MDEYLKAQRENLDQGVGTAIYRELVGAIDDAYRAAFGKAPENTQLVYIRMLLICHKSLLSAASLIAQAQPDDSVAITRRAIEATKVALAIHANSENGKKWLAFDERQARWTARNQGEKPKFFKVQFESIHGDTLIDTLDRFIGILSDARVHFTPEFYSTLVWEVRQTSSEKGEVFLNYFQPNFRELEREFITLGAVHGTILNAFNRCFEGALTSDRALARMWAVGKHFSDDYNRRYKEPATPEDGEGPQS